MLLLLLLFPLVTITVDRALLIVISQEPASAGDEVVPHCFLKVRMKTGISLSVHPLCTDVYSVPQPIIIAPTLNAN